MKLLVTGGCGFIGSNFIRYWLTAYPQDRIINLDKLTYAGHLSSTRDYAHHPRYAFIKGDINNRLLLERILPGMDIVVHFAAESHVDRSLKGPALFVKTNVLGTQNLLDASLQAKVSRFHHVSTDEVFGDLPLNSSVKFNETTPYCPHSPYSASKAASDHLVRAYYYSFGLPVTISNCSNNFGPFSDPEKFLPRLITNLILGRKVPVYGDGLYVRDWLYVLVHCRAIDKIINSGKIGETYCLGGLTRDISNLDITRSLLRLFNKDDSQIDFVADRPGHDRRYAVDWSKIHHQLGWQPEFDFFTYLKQTVVWYQQNQWWWRPLKIRAEKIYH